MVFWVCFMGILFGFLFGIGWALCVTLDKVKNSNDIGNSKGEFEDFEGRIDIIDHVKDT